MADPIDMLAAAVRRVEAKADAVLEQLQALAAALADDYDDASETLLDLEGEPAGGERDQSREL